MLGLRKAESFSETYFSLFQRAANNSFECNKFFVKECVVFILKWDLIFFFSLFLSFCAVNTGFERLQGGCQVRGREWARWDGGRGCPAEDGLRMGFVQLSPPPPPYSLVLLHPFFCIGLQIHGFVISSSLFSD